MKALIIGATGATGKDLVDILLNDSDYKEVVIFVRRHTGINHPKLVEVLTDFDQPEKVASSINGDVLFSCLGTTLKAAGSKGTLVSLIVPFFLLIQIFLNLFHVLC